MSGQKLCQILEKPWVHYSGKIFSLVLMKLGHNVCLNEISDKFENGSCQVAWSDLRKNLVYALVATFSV